MPNPSLDWLNDLPDLRVTGVTRVTPQKSATYPVTQPGNGKVTRVTNDAAVTLVTQGENARVTLQPAENLAVTPVTRVTLKSNDVLDELWVGIDQLQSMRAPRITKREAWPEIVADAVRISEEGWASQAIGLGWELMHLFGVEPSSDPDTWEYSLAVILAGRSIRAVDADSFYLSDGGVRRFFAHRPRPALTKYLWELG